MEIISEFFKCSIVTLRLSQYDKGFKLYVSLSLSKTDVKMLEVLKKHNVTLRLNSVWH